MDNILSLLGSAASDVPAQQTYSDDMERRARANGFRNANEMMLWAKQRNTPTGGTISGDNSPSMSAAMMWHPKNILEYVLGSIRNATGY